MVFNTLCSMEMHDAQELYAFFCSRDSDPVKNPIIIECIFECKLTVLMICCAKRQLAHPLQSLRRARPMPGTITRSGTCQPYQCQHARKATISSIMSRKFSKM